jgi:hypothetical protein
VLVDRMGSCDTDAARSSDNVLSTSGLVEGYKGIN